jgi:hypothetical protein
MLGHPCVVDVLRESICRPFVLSIERSEVESMDWVTWLADPTWLTLADPV